MKKALALTLILALIVSAVAGTFLVSLATANPIATPDIWVVSPQTKVYSSSEVELIFAFGRPDFNFTSFYYSLDGQANVAITGNTTLKGLSWGSHHVVVYGTNTDGYVGSSWEVHFDIIYSTKWIIIAIVLVVVICLALLLRKRLVRAFRGKKTSVFWFGLGWFLFSAALTSMPSMWFIGNYLYPKNVNAVNAISWFYGLIFGIGSTVFGLILMKSGINKNQSPQTPNSQ